MAMQQNLGAEGIDLYAAALANQMPGGVTAFAGLILQVASQGHAPVPQIAISLIVIGCVAVAAGTLRAFQARRTGRVFRGGRPPVPYR
jgi:hypothetical protein